MKFLQNVPRSPVDRVSVKIIRRIKPKAELLLSVANAITIQIGVNSVRIAANVPKEFKVYLIVIFPFRGQLNNDPPKIISDYQIQKYIYMRSNTLI